MTLLVSNQKSWHWVSIHTNSLNGLGRTFFSDCTSIYTKNHFQNPGQFFQLTFPFIFAFLHNFFPESRNDLIDKFQKDNPDYKVERIEIEVDKFMMDSEMANGYIKYLKDMKVNAATPRNYEAELEKELSLSNPKTVRSSSL